MEYTMQTPVEIDFQGMPVQPPVREAISKHIDELEHRFGRITVGRVVVKAPGAHHRVGLYEINIRLALPDGHEVNVARTPKEDERQTDLNFAINDAFKHARRQLQDEVRRLQGHVKRHEHESVAVVARIDPSGEFGFLETSDGREIYFHRNSVVGALALKEGARVTFVEESGEKGLQASTVKMMRKHNLRT
jgi:cold shock CspA family protein